MGRSLRLTSVALAAFIMVAGVIAALPRIDAEPPRSTSIGGNEVVRSFPFIENRGQVDGSVRYYLPGETSFGFTADGVRLVVGGTTPISLGFEGARRVPPDPGAPTETVVSYLEGPRSEWHTGLSTYARLRYEELWPGVDAAYQAGSGRLKYAFRVAPGANASQIRLSYDGASGLSVAPDGSLRISTAAGTIRDAAPYAYQVIGGQRVEVAAAYDLTGTGYGFRLGEYDPNRPLVIDPEFVYSGFIGGSQYDSAESVAVDGTGNAFVVGQTESPDFPATALDQSLDVPPDGYIAKVRADGTGLLYAAFIGGSGSDQVTDVAVDAAGNAYIAGDTSSSDFPTEVGPFTSSPEPGPDAATNADAFVAKLNPDGTDLLYSGFLGGTLEDADPFIAVDAAGSAYVTGYTNSTDYPTAGAADASYGGNQDGFISKVRPDGTGLTYSGYVGGTAYDYGQAIAVDAAGSAYLGLQTGSSDIPKAVGPDLTISDSADGFVMKLRPDGSGPIYGGYVGGSNFEDLWGIAVDQDGNAYVTGYTQSAATFPTAVGPDLTHNGGGNDAFVAKVDATGASFVYSGFVGGTGSDTGDGIAVDPRGNAYIGGATSSSDFPLLGAADNVFAGGTEAFAAKIQPSGTGLVYSTYVGGGSGDSAAQGGAIAVDSGGNAYLVGITTSSDLPTAVGPDLSYNGTTDGFITKIQTTETCLGVAVAHLGSEGNDRIQTGAGEDVVLSLGGNDTIRTGGSRDLVCAGGGKDKVNGGGGNQDRLLGEAGNDRLSGGAGRKDRMMGGPGRDRLTGGGGKSDLCKGGPGKDKAARTCERGSP